MIETKRLKIYPMSNEQMKKLISEQKILELKEAYSEMLQGCIDNPSQREWYATWNIELKNIDESVGNLSFKGLGNDGILEIGYGLKSDFENNGYMTEAVSAVVRWAANQTGVKKVEVEAESNNYASIRVLEKAGFVENGEIGGEGPRYTWRVNL